ncbi:response regulator transcription factor [Chengkuizengella sediminis]|uniref:response regulator transcription factor n=1 Tax=Chengkuizengella sediminis TaxID=1885917 RepID=UPI00138A0976|nr:response regulator transcription factor [Chengkuizengella sediminis]NDI35821.1 response regulator transcription factor [Chengkuizengella sediminis]
MDLKILIVDDEENIREIIRLYLEKEGFLTFECKDGKEAMELLEKESFHCAVIDIMMPNLNGWVLCQEIKQFYEIPVLMVTAKSEIDDRIKGFKVGTDDYLTKPFHPIELVMRVKCILKRYYLLSIDIINFDGILIDANNYSVSSDTTSILLPVKQFQLLYVMAKFPGKIFSRSQLIELFWGVDYTGNERVIDTHIKRLRSNLSDFEHKIHLQTVHGLGYKLEKIQ